MRKLLLSILALVLLATTALAMPEGWRRLNGMVLNEGVEQQAGRGGSFYLNLEQLRLEMYPWQDGSGDVLTMRPVFPPGTKVVRPDGAPVRDGLVEVPYGWRAELEGGALDGVVLRLMDLQGDKVPEALDDFLAPGLALIYTFDAADVPTTGEWIPKRIAFGGIASECGFYVQADLSADPAITQAPFIPGSLAIYHNTKRNNIGFRKYGIGKIAHMPRPLMVGRNATGYTGYAFGDYREVSHGVFDKVFDMDAILADPSQTITKFGIGAPTSVHVSADVGWQTMGGTSNADTGKAWLSKVLVSPLAGDCVALVCGLSNDRTAAAWDSGFYTGTLGDSDTIIVDHNTTVADSAVADGSGYWNTKTIAASAAPVTNGGSYRVIYDAGASTFMQDFPGGNPGHDTIAHTDNTAFPSPLGTTGSRTSTNSVYMTVETTVQLPATTLAALTDTTPTRGDSTTLSATITDGDNTTTASEYFVGTDPGEGSGTSATLLGGSSPFTISEAIDTTGLDSGAYTVSVRGFSSDGWGAVDTVNMTVGLGVPQNFAGVGGDTIVTLTWDAVVGATHYDISWGTSPGPSGGGNLGTVLSSPKIHTGRTNGDTYYYKISSSDAGSENGISDEISVVAGVAGGGASAGISTSIGLEL